MNPKPADEAASGEFVQSLARGLAVIRVFDSEHPELSLTEVARRAEISPAAARRFLHTLEALGYVRSTGRSFALTPRVLELGFSYLSSMPFTDVVQPHLESLSRELDESVSAAVLAGSEIVYVARVLTRRIMTVDITIGTRFPAYATSMGRVLLAHLPQHERELQLDGLELRALTDRTISDTATLAAELDRIRQNGWAIVDGELELGLRSAAAPVRGKDGAVVAAINVSTSAMRRSAEQLREQHLPKLLKTAAAIESDLRLL